MVMMTVFVMSPMVTLVVMLVPVLVVMTARCLSFAGCGDCDPSSCAQSATDYGTVASADSRADGCPGTSAYGAAQYCI